MTLIYNGSITEGAKSITGQKKKNQEKCVNLFLDMKHNFCFQRMKSVYLINYCLSYEDSSLWILCQYDGILLITDSLV